MDFYSLWNETRKMGIDDSAMLQAFLRSDESAVDALYAGDEGALETAYAVIDGIDIETFFEAIKTGDYNTEITPAMVPCFSNFENGAHRLIELLEFEPNGLSFADAGFQLIDAVKEGARVKYGENQAKLARMMSLVTISSNKPAVVKATPWGSYLVSTKAKEHIKVLNQRQVTHNGSNDRLYGIWINMKHRCNNPNDPRYYDYGGRGITVCNEWLHSYENFKDWSMRNGYTERLSIDRINVNGNYEPSNCRWATNKEQQNNMRSNRLLTYLGETHTVSEWAEITGINKSTISKRIDRSGWSIERALTTIVN